jgi:hypothetical protein
MSVNTANSFKGFNNFNDSKKEKAKAFYNAKTILSTKAAFLLSKIANKEAKGSTILRTCEKLEKVNNRINANGP